MDSLGNKVRSALTTVRPPMPESNTPIGCALPLLFAVSLFITAVDGNRRWMMIRRLDGIFGTERFADRVRVRRQICFRYSEVRAA